MDVGDKVDDVMQQLDRIYEMDDFRCTDESMTVYLINRAKMIHCSRAPIWSVCKSRLDEERGAAAGSQPDHEPTGSGSTVKGYTLDPGVRWASGGTLRGPQADVRGAPRS